MTRPSNHRAIAATESPKTEYTPKNENIIIATGKIKTVLTFTVRSFVWMKPKTSRVKNTIKTQTGV